MKQHLQRQLLLLLCAIATGWTAAWAQATTVVWEKVTDYSQLSTSDTYVIVGNGISSQGNGTIWCSLKNNQVSTANYLPIGRIISTSKENVYSFDDYILDTFDENETWKLETTSTSGVYYIKSTKGDWYLQNANDPKSTIKSAPTSTKDDKYRQWRIHYQGTNYNGKTVTGLYNVGGNREFALYYTESNTNWRCYGSSYYGDFEGAEVVLYRKVTTVPVTIGGAKYASFCSTCPLDFSSTGITVYKAKGNGQTVVLTPITDGIVPARQGVVLYCENATSVNVPLTAKTSSTNWTDNELVGITERTLVSATGADGRTNYILSKEDSGVGFYLAAADDGAYLGANRAYLSTKATAESGAPFLAFEEVETASISEELRVNSEQFATAPACYDFSGRRVEKPTKGIYIVNGKKVLIP